MSEATFEGVAPGVDLVVGSTRTGVKEDLIFDSADVPGVYEFPLTLAGVDVKEAGGGLVFTDKGGDVVAQVPAGFMEDAAGEESEGVSMRLVEGEDPVVRVEVDTEWLSAKGREFPVRVDPTIQFMTGVEDTMVQEGNPSTNYSGYTYMRHGKLNNGNNNNALVKFDVSAIEGKTVNWSELYLYNNYSKTCADKTTRASVITEDWSTSTVNWPGPATGDVAGESTESKPELATFSDHPG